MVRAARAFNVEDEGEPILHLLRYTNEEIIPIFLRHFDLVASVKPKHILSRFLLRRRLWLLGRLLLFGVDHVYLREERISLLFHYYAHVRRT